MNLSGNEISGKSSLEFSKGVSERGVTSLPSKDMKERLKRPHNIDPNKWAISKLTEGEAQKEWRNFLFNQPTFTGTIYFSSSLMCSIF